MLPNPISHQRFVFRHENSWERKNSSASSTPISSNRSRRISRWRLPWLSSWRACSMMRSVSTPLSFKVIVGLDCSSPILISPTPPATHSRHRRSTSAPSLPGTGVLMVPWFSAARRFALSPFSDSTPGTRAASNIVLISRSSVLNPIALRSSGGRSSISDLLIPCCDSTSGRSF